jgi:DNA polymerase I-like protein with 3'-5' exonuclease and polymerase domains
MPTLWREEEMKIVADFPPEVRKGQLVCMDFETFGQTDGKLHRPNGTFACISVLVDGDPNVYQLYDSKDLTRLVSIVGKGRWVFHNALYDLRQFRRYTRVAHRPILDTMLMEQAMMGGYYQTFSLGDLSRRWLGKAMEKETREQFYNQDKHLPEYRITPQMKQYAAQDVITTLAIAKKQLAKYEGDPAFKAYTVADEPMIFPILDMPGIRVDVGNWQAMVDEFSMSARNLEDELGVNVMSPGQVKEAARKLRIHLQDTSASTLMAFIDHPFIQKVIEARMYRKAVSTYGTKWLEDNVEDDGKVYADYHITGASTTGRLSCSNPNMQNIPQRKLPKYRSMFVASEGNVIRVSDIAQQEPCILAYHTQDRKLLDAIRNREDLHLAVAREIFNDPSLTKADSEKRAVGKMINLGTSYGLTEFGLATKLGISEEQARVFLNSYFRKFSGVHGWIQQQRQNGFRNGYVTTALGRRSWLNPYDQAWQNNAINSPIQGGAADFGKIWTRKIWEQSNRQGVPFTLVALVHDEDVDDVPRECIKESNRIQKETFLETAETLYRNVPFSYESEYGVSWGAKSIATEMVDIGDEG